MSSDMEEDDLFYLYPPCAACKTQRKRCNMFCEVSSLFPQTKSKEYQNAHRLFGSSNIQKMIVSIKPSEVDVCADSILTEGLAGKNDPVHGCYSLVGNLKAEVDAAERELAAIKRLLALCKNDQATDAAAAAIARQMILRRGGLNIPVPPVPESPELSLSPSMPGGPAEVDHRLQQNHQGVHQMLDGLMFPRAVEIVRILFYS